MGGMKWWQLSLLEILAIAFVLALLAAGLGLGLRNVTLPNS